MPVRQHVLILRCLVTSRLYRYRNRRSRTPSASRSPRYRGRRYSRSRSPVRSRSPIDGSRSRLSPRVVRRRSPSRSRSPSKSRSPADSQSPRRISKDRSRSLSGSPDGKKGLVSYGDGSPDSERWKDQWWIGIPALFQTQKDVPFLSLVPFFFIISWRPPKMDSSLCIKSGLDLYQSMLSRICSE